MNYNKMKMTPQEALTLAISNVRKHVYAIDKRTPSHGLIKAEIISVRVDVSANRGSPDHGEFMPPEVSYRLYNYGWFRDYEVAFTPNEIDKLLKK